MKKIFAALGVLAFCLQAFSLPASKSLSAEQNLNSLATHSIADPISDEVADSQVFFDNAINSRSKTPDYSAKVEALLARMTLEEKVGQMTQLEIGMVCDGKDQDLRINPAKLEKAVVRYGVGSILNVSGEALTIDKWHEII